MYMHLYRYEPIAIATAALHVRQLPPYVARPDPTLRAGAPSARAARYAAHHPASALACRRGVPGTTGQNARDGQHKPHSHARDHGPPGLDHSPPRQRRARKMVRSVQRRRGATQACSSGLGKSSIAPAPSGRGAGLEKPSATHAASNRRGQNSRRLAMNYKKVTTGIIFGWFVFALSASALHLFKNDSNRIGLAVAIAALTPIIVFSLWFAASAGFRQFALSLNPRILTSAQAWRIVGFTFLVLYSAGLLPGVFALPAGWGDIAIGATAPLAGLKLANFNRRGGFIFWQILGIFDLVMAVTVGTTARWISPNEVGTALMTVLPLSLIPTFAVPLFIVLHIICITQARQWKAGEYSHVGELSHASVS